MSSRNMPLMKHTIDIYQKIKKNIKTKYLSEDVLKYLNIFHSKKLINKELVVGNYASQISKYSTESTQEQMVTNEPVVKVSSREKSLIKKNGKLPVLKTGKMMINEKMKASDLVFNVKDNLDYDYLVKKMSKSIKKNDHSIQNIFISKEKLRNFKNLNNLNFKNSRDNPIIFSENDIINNTIDKIPNYINKNIVHKILVSKKEVLPINEIIDRETDKMKFPIDRVSKIKSNQKFLKEIKQKRNIFSKLIQI